MAAVNVAYNSLSISDRPRHGSFDFELQQMPADFAVTELWRVLTGDAQGRTDDAQVTVFDSVGFALEDYSALRLLRDCAKELGLGREIDLVPRMRDPKDLFGHLMGLHGSVRKAA